jgi:hypothetical protein
MNTSGICNEVSFRLANFFSFKNLENFISTEHKLSTVLLRFYTSITNDHFYSIQNINDGDEFWIIDICVSLDSLDKQKLV